MIKRLYVHNFRCLENLELPITGISSSLLIGRNGAGKSSVGRALQVLQSIARGTNRVGDLVRIEDFAGGRSEVPIRLELEVVLAGVEYHYVLVLELPSGFKELRVAEERLSHDGIEVYSRNTADVTLSRPASNGAQFIVDWHLVALPIIQQGSTSDPIHIFSNWLGRMLIIAPQPALISGESQGDTLMPNRDCSNFGAWFSGLLAHSPAAYGRIAEFMQEVMPDFGDIKNPLTGKDARSLSVQFTKDEKSLSIAFSDLSDGEKCFFVCATVLAANEFYGPLFCFWDEVDNHLSLDETGHFVMGLRRSFEKAGGQILLTSHNPEAIRKFSAENTLLLHRHSHLEPTIVRPIEDVEYDGSLVDALIRGDV